MKTLTKREQAVIALRKEGKTLEQIGKVFEVSRERIRQILVACCGTSSPHELLKE